MRITFFLIFLFIAHLSFSQKWEKILDGNFISKNKYPYIEYRIDSADRNPYFDCDYYHIFKNSNLPVISFEDSINAVRYRDKLSKIYEDAGGYEKGNYRYYLPHIKGVLDTNLIEYLAKNCKTFQYKSIDYTVAKAIAESDAIVVARLISKREYRDTSICLFLKTEYVFEVIEVLHAYPHFNLLRGQKILMKGQTGYVGCGIGGANTKMDGSTIHEYSLNDTICLPISKIGYTITFWDILKSKKYTDKYCSQAFRMDFDYTYCTEAVTNNKKDFIQFVKTYLK